MSQTMSTMFVGMLQLLLQVGDENLVCIFIKGANTGGGQKVADDSTIEV